MGFLKGLAKFVLGFILGTSIFLLLIYNAYLSLAAVSLLAISLYVVRKKLSLILGTLTGIAAFWIFVIFILIPSILAPGL